MYDIFHNITNEVLKPGATTIALAGGYKTIKYLWERRQQSRKDVADHTLSVQRLNEETFIGLTTANKELIDTLSVEVDRMNKRLDQEEAKRRQAEVNAEFAMMARDEARKALDGLRAEYDAAQRTIAELRMENKDKHLLTQVQQRRIAELEMLVAELKVRIDALEASLVDRDNLSTDCETSATVALEETL